MCIRDRRPGERVGELVGVLHETPRNLLVGRVEAQRQVRGCLLYTSDAADERSSVDLGGRRIIKKKKDARIGHGETRLGQDKSIG